MKNDNFENNKTRIICGISILINLFFIWETNFKNEPIISIDGNTILTQQDLERIAPDKYKSNLINDAINSAIFSLELDRYSIEGSDEGFTEMSNLFPELGGDDVYDFVDVYYFYELFKETVDINLVEEYFKNYDGDDFSTLYEIAIFDTVEHQFAETVQNLLEEGLSVTEIEQLHDIEFLKIYTPSVDELLAYYGFDVDEEKVSSIGDVFHVMDDEGMHVLLVNDSVTMETNREQFINLYFSENYYSIKTDIMNTSKSKYVIKYH